MRCCRSAELCVYEERCLHEPAMRQRALPVRLSSSSSGETRPMRSLMPPPLRLVGSEGEVQSFGRNAEKKRTVCSRSRTEKRHVIFLPTNGRLGVADPEVRGTHTSLTARSAGALTTTLCATDHQDAPRTLTAPRQGTHSSLRGSNSWRRRSRPWGLGADE